MNQYADPRSYRFWLLNFGLAVAYSGLAAVTGRLFAAFGPLPAPIWPAASVALAGVWYFGRAAWPGLFIGATLAFWFYPLLPPSHWLAPVIAFGSLVAAITANWLLQRRCGPVAPFYRVPHVIVFMVGAGLLQPVIAATIGTSVVSLALGRPAEGLFTIWLKWLIADSAGALSFTPIVMLLARPRPVMSAVLPILEAPLIAVVTLALSVAIYWVANADTYVVYALPLLVVLPLAWAALRFSLIEALAILLSNALLAWIGTLLGLGALNAIGDRYPIYTLNLFFIASIVAILGTNVLVTELHERQQALRRARRDLEKKIRARTLELSASEARFRNYFNIGQIGLAEASADLRWVRVNNHLCQMLGYSERELIGVSCPLMVHPDDQAAHALQQRQLLAGEIDRISMEKRFRRRDGSYLPTIVSIQAERGPDKTIDYFFVAIQDIGQRKTMEDELRRRATVDDLTGVANRNHFTEWGEREIARAHRHGTALCFMMFDVDHFKRINDGFGHLAGDIALKTIAHHCRESLRGFDLIGRVGGEEFAVLLPDTTLQGAAELAERMRYGVAKQTIKAPHGMSLPTITISIGVTMLKPDDRIEQLFSRSDAALYRAKQAGRNRVEIDNS